MDELHRLTRQYAFEPDLEDCQSSLYIKPVWVFEALQNREIPHTYTAARFFEDCQCSFSSKTPPGGDGFASKANFVTWSPA